MSEKTKAIILIVIILGATVGFGVYFIQKNKILAPMPQAIDKPQTQPIEVDKNDTQKNQEATVEGKVRSMNEKQIYIELADGNGSAVNINASTPVRMEGDNSVSDLTVLKAQAIVSVKVNENNDAIEILIKK